MTTATTYDIRNFSDLLVNSKASKTKYHCPVCNGNDFDIDPKSGKYHCFNSDCTPKEIREAIDRLKPEEIAWVKPLRPIATTEYFYPDRDGNPLVKVVRKDDGRGKKDFYQYHWDGHGWAKGNPVKHLVPIYRYLEVRAAIAQNKLIFHVEGEATADLLWDLGIPATCTIGGSDGYKKYGNYSQDFTGARIVVCPDRDKAGLKHMNQFIKDFADQIESYYLAGTRSLWQNPQGGMDIADDIRDHKLNAISVMERLIDPDTYRSAIALPPFSKPKPNTPTRPGEIDYLKLGKILGFDILPHQLDARNIPTSKMQKLKIDLLDRVGDKLKYNLMTRNIELHPGAHTCDHPYNRKIRVLDLNGAKDHVSALLGYDPSTNDCIVALDAVARVNSYHPVGEYLKSLSTHQVNPDLIKNFPKHFFHNDDPLQNQLFYRKLIACVARVMNPGVKDDSLLVLQGSQGVGKSSAIAALANGYSNGKRFVADASSIAQGYVESDRIRWFNDDIRSLEDKDELAKLSRFWLLELAEVDYLFSKKEVEQFKRFLSTTTDTFRPPYGRVNIEAERTCALFASTNKQEILKDPTGDRRYWVVEVKGKVDTDRIAAMRDTIWASALAAYNAGETHHLTDEEKYAHTHANSKWRDDTDPWYERLLASLSTVTSFHSDREYVKIQTIMDRLLSIPVDRQSKRDRNRIGTILGLLGFENKGIKIDGKTEKVWVKTDTEQDFKMGNSTIDDPHLTNSWVTPQSHANSQSYLSYSTNLANEVTTEEINILPVNVEIDPDLQKIEQVNELPSDPVKETSQTQSKGQLSELPNSITQDVPKQKSNHVGSQVTHADPFHSRGSSTGSIESIQPNGEYLVHWHDDGDNQIAESFRSYDRISLIFI